MSKTEMDSKMRKIIFLFLLVTCLNPSWSLENNLTMPEVPIELSITSEDDSERELSSQLEEVDSRTGGWSSWSEWSACSRSCDGGASHQLRTCKSGPCRGEHVHYKICNMQAIVAFFAVFAAANAGLLAPSLYSAPYTAYSAPVVSPYGAPVVSAYGAPGVSAYGAPGVVAENTVVAGPSGTIVSGKTLGAPVLAGYGAPFAARAYLG